MTRATALPIETSAPERSPAEVLLFHLAADLVRLPFEGHTRKLHIRALELKRLVQQWTRTAPSEVERRAMRDEILDLKEQAARWREIVR